MPHDKHLNPLQVGDRVTVRGIVKEITSEGHEFCNITFETEEPMAPTPNRCCFGLNAGQVELVPQGPAHTMEIQGPASQRVQG